MMKSILLSHAARYPLMEATDAVKLLYQSEFGGGHLIRNEEVCRNRLLEEYRSTPQCRDMPLAEDIGGGIVRIHLAALDHSGMTPDQLGLLFIRSAATVRGSMEGFRKKLELLKELTCQGYMPFSLSVLEEYLAHYEAAGFPPVSHSDTYRNAYHPAYRVVQAQLLSELHREGP